MALTKTMAGYFDEKFNEIFKEDGSFSHKEKIQTWIDQTDVDMHPLEEEAILKSRAIHDLKIRIPVKPSQVDEHEWLIEYGPDYIKQKRKEWQAAFDTAQPEIQVAEEEFQKAHQAWCEHANLCVAHGLCPNKYQGDAQLSLTKPLEGEN